VLNELQDLNLSADTLDVGLLAYQFLLQHLDCDQLTSRQMLSELDLSEGTLAERFCKTVTTDLQGLVFKRLGLGVHKIICPELHDCIVCDRSSSGHCQNRTVLSVICAESFKNSPSDFPGRNGGTG